MLVAPNFRHSGWMTSVSEFKMDKAQGYDRLSASYHALEWLVFGGQLQRARTALIDQLPAWQQLLILGDGDGRLLEQLYIYRRNLARRGAVRTSGATVAPWSITSVDFSSAMLQQQRSRLAAVVSKQPCSDAWAGVVRFEQRDALSYAPQRQAFDVVVTPFFLDCFSPAELSEHLPLWLTGLRDDGVYLYVDFTYPRAPWQRPRARLLLWAMHLFFARQTGLGNSQLVDCQPLLQRNAMRLAAERISSHGMLVAQTWRRAGRSSAFDE